MNDREENATMYWVMLQEDGCRFRVLGTYKTERWAVRKAQTDRALGRIVVRELQPYGSTVYDTASNGD